MEGQNLDTVEEAYEALFHNDIPTLLDLLADGVDWLMPGPQNILPLNLDQKRVVKRIARTRIVLLGTVTSFARVVLASSRASANSIAVWVHDCGRGRFGGVILRALVDAAGRREWRRRAPSCPPSAARRPSAPTSDPGCVTT